MSKAKDYGLSFSMLEMDKFLPKPIINHSNRDTIEMKNFIVNCSAQYCQEIIDEISSIDWNIVNQHEIQSQNEYDILYLFSPPNRAAFWTGFDGSGYYEIPLSDFTDILQEWIAFLNSIPYEHRLSNR